MLAESADCGEAAAIPDIYYESCGLLIARDRHFVLAVKAGDNGDSHNHNDVGSFTLYRDGRPFFIDLGVETYTAKTFSEDRYSIWTMQSQYHNLATFRTADGLWLQQQPGEAYGAEAVSCSLQGMAGTPGESGSKAAPGTTAGQTAGGELYREQTERAGQTVRMQMELAGAYPAGCVRSYERTVCFEKERRIVLEDRTEGMAPGEYWELSLMTYEEPQVMQLPEREELRGARAIRLGECGNFRLEGVANLRCEEIPIEDARLGEMWQHSVYRLRIRPNGNRLRLIIPATA